jgi:predicted dithiol-disulfide oxidoreductase (DUF899 family)
MSTQTMTSDMKKPKLMSPQEWEAARQKLLVKEKELTRARDALAAERRRMPWLAVEKEYEFDGPDGKASLLDLFDGRRQLIVYRAFFEPGVHGWPDHACIGCSMAADHVGNLAHVNARDTTLVFASHAPQKDIERLKARMGWRIPWYTITDDFDKDFGVDEWHGRSDARSRGRTHPRATLRPQRTSGGTGTTNTVMPRRPRSGVQRSSAEFGRGKAGDGGAPVRRAATRSNHSLVSFASEGCGVSLRLREPHVHD